MTDDRNENLSVSMLRARQEGEHGGRNRWRWVGGVLALPLVAVGLIRDGFQGAWSIVWLVLGAWALVSAAYWAWRHLRDVGEKKEARRERSP